MPEAKGLRLADGGNGERQMNDEVIAESPCVGDCRPDDNGICQCCFLSAEENDRWNHISNQERLVILQNTEARKRASSAG